MPVIPRGWRDFPDRTTPITAQALEDIEARLGAYSDQLLAQNFLTPTGNWDGTRQYYTRDLVTRNHITYIATANSLNVDPATDNGSHWQEMGTPVLFSQLSDVDISGVQDGDLPLWVASAGKLKRVNRIDLHPYVDVLKLTSDPGSVGDWGPLLNGRIAANKHRLIFDDYGADLPVTTQINLNSSKMVTFEGVSAYSWVQDGYESQLASSRLVWKGAGTTPAITGVASNGLTLRDMGIYYDNAGFTGNLIQMGGISGATAFERCHIASKLYALTSAKCLISLSEAIVVMIDKCALGGAQRLIRGKETNYSSGVVIRGTTFIHADVSFIANMGDMWIIEDECVFEVHGTPAVLDSDFAGDLVSYFKFADNWVGDMDGAGRSLFLQKTSDYWFGEGFRGNHIESLGDPAGTPDPTKFPIWDLKGGGIVNIRDNPKISRVDEGVMVDLGNVSTGAHAKDAVNITGNAWVSTVGEAVVHRTGHSNVNIGNNGVGVGALEIQSVSGHERLSYPDRRTDQPTVVKGAQAPNGTPSIAGSDREGFLRVNSGVGATPGSLAVVTFGTPYESAPNTPEARTLVHLTAVGSPESATIGAYYDSDANGWTLKTAGDPADGDNLFYSYKTSRM